MVISPIAIGVSDFTCEVDGDIFNEWKLPIPETKNATKPFTLQPNHQEASKFFQLPGEMRRMIYIELMGNRRIHIEYGWMLDSPFKPRSNKDGKRWDWWHGVCQSSDSFIRDAHDDRSWSRRDEACASRTKGLQNALSGTKLQGVEWLRCCQLGQATVCQSPRTSLISRS